MLTEDESISWWLIEFYQNESAYNTSFVQKPSVSMKYKPKKDNSIERCTGSQGSPQVAPRDWEVIKRKNLVIKKYSKPDIACMLVVKWICKTG